MSSSTNNTTISSTDQRNHGRFVVQGNQVIDSSLINNQKEFERTQVTKYVNECVWPYKKFMTKDSELDWGGTMQKRMCHKLGVQNREDKSLWERNKEWVRQALKRKRNNVMEAMRKNMKCK